MDATGYLAEADEAVAAAALIAAQCPEGEPVDTPYGPETPMPIFPLPFGRSLTKPSPASSATMRSRRQIGSPRRTGSNGG
ncbi:DUF4259 domain-containing protein [Streptomyces mirabilis]|uniref:DUF4259 domain-containing protein n=1 Tax=Streptomyces mirabilis TaxID=68239 RepID=UPI0036C41A77